MPAYPRMHTATSPRHWQQLAWKTLMSSAVALLLCPPELGFQVLQHGRLSSLLTLILTPMEQKGLESQCRDASNLPLCFGENGAYKGQVNQDHLRPAAGSSAVPTGPCMNLWVMTGEPYWWQRVDQQELLSPPLEGCQQKRETAFSSSAMAHQVHVHYVLYTMQKPETSTLCF